MRALTMTTSPPYGDLVQAVFCPPRLKMLIGMEVKKIFTLAPKTTLRTSLKASRDTDHEAQLTEEQKVKAERLKSAKMFVTMLKSGTVPLTNQTLHGSSVNPPESRASRSANENNLTGKEGEHSSSPPTDGERTATVANLDRIYIGEEHSEQLARISYRFRSGGCEDNNEEEDRDRKSHNRGSSRSKYRSRSRRYDEDDEKENVLETDGKHYRRYWSHSSFTEIDDERESNEMRTGTMSALTRVITLAIHRTRMLGM